MRSSLTIFIGLMMGLALAAPVRSNRIFLFWLFGKT
jgi:hypothetical protein